MNLIELYNNISKNIPYCDKGSLHNYIHSYNELFEPIKNDTKVIVELGIFDGGSMCLWRNYFMNAEIIGIDINPRCNMWNLPQYKMQAIIGDATKEETIKNLPNDIDIIIDDASHILDLTISSFKLLFPKLKKGGLYIIEDVQEYAIWKTAFDNLNIPYKIIDTRLHNNVYDDVLFVFTA